jgi:hypothetical protein
MVMSMPILGAKATVRTRVHLTTKLPLPSSEISWLMANSLSSNYILGRGFLVPNRGSRGSRYQELHAINHMD